MRVLDDWLLTPFRLAIHEPTATAVIADVHLGYAAARRRAGDAVPLATPEAALAPLRAAHARHAFQRLVVAGDLFEAGFDGEAYPALLALLSEMHVEWLGLVPGNHDRGIANEANVPTWPNGYLLGDWLVLHDERRPGKRCVTGHWHPCVRRGPRKVPCYVVSSDHLVLPAFSTDAAGVDVARDERWECYRVIAIDECANTSEAP